MAIPIPTRQLFIDGEWREPVLKKRIPIINPATEQIIGLFLCFYLLLFVCVFLRSKLMMMCMLYNFVSGFWFAPESDKEKSYLYSLYVHIFIFILVSDYLKEKLGECVCFYQIKIADDEHAMQLCFWVLILTRIW